MAAASAVHARTKERIFSSSRRTHLELASNLLQKFLQVRTLPHVDGVLYPIEDDREHHVCVRDGLDGAVDQRLVKIKDERDGGIRGILRGQADLVVGIRDHQVVPGKGFDEEIRVKLLLFVLLDVGVVRFLRGVVVAVLPLRGTGEGGGGGVSRVVRYFVARVRLLLRLLHLLLCGMEWVLEQQLAYNALNVGTLKSVANVAFGTNGKTDTLDEAIASMVNSGITTIIAAGNYGGTMRAGLHIYIYIYIIYIPSMYLNNLAFLAFLAHEIQYR